MRYTHYEWQLRREKRKSISSQWILFISFMRNWIRLAMATNDGSMARHWLEPQNATTLALSEYIRRRLYILIDSATLHERTADGRTLARAQTTVTTYANDSERKRDSLLVWTVDPNTLHRAPITRRLVSLGMIRGIIRANESRQQNMFALMWLQLNAQMLSDSKDVVVDLSFAVEVECNSSSANAESAVSHLSAV